MSLSILCYTNSDTKYSAPAAIVGNSTGHKKLYIDDSELGHVGRPRGMKVKSALRKERPKPYNVKKVDRATSPMPLDRYIVKKVDKATSPMPPSKVSFSVV